MPTTRPRRGSALLLAAVLLLAALPAAAQPAAWTAGSAGETALVPSWLQAASSWLIGLLPASGHELLYSGQRTADLDPNGATTPELHRESEADPNGEPTVEPQRGPGADPNG